MTDTAKPTPEDFKDDQIVVATPHVDRVRQVLDQRRVNVGTSDASAELGLTLLELPGDQVVRAAAENERPGAPENPLSRLLDLVYQDFEAKFHGWVPVMGKNRVVQSVTGAHNIGGGGACRPQGASMQLRPRDGEAGRDVRVGLADTALYPHPWLVGAYIAARSSLWGDDEPADFEGGHATFIAGLILQHAPGATLDVRSVLGPDATADSWDVAKKLVQFGHAGLDVLNLSFGCFTDDNKPPLVLSTALDRLDPRVVVVAAAGNHGDTSDKGRPVWPAAFEEVVAVAAADQQGNQPQWSPKLDLPWVDVVASGQNLESTFPKPAFDRLSVDGSPNESFNGFALWSGTSFAAAQVSGAMAALVKSEGGAVAALARLLGCAPRLAVAASESGGSKPWIG